MTTKAAAFTGTYSDLRFVKTRSVAVISVEIAIEQADAFVAAFGTPQPGKETHVAIARLNGTPKQEQVLQAEEWKHIEVRSDHILTKAGPRTWGSLTAAQQSGIRCNDLAFRKFLVDHYGYDTNTSDETAEAVREICGVTSRKDIERDQKAYAKWSNLDAEFLSWLNAPVMD